MRFRFSVAAQPCTFAPAGSWIAKFAVKVVTTEFLDSEALDTAALDTATYPQPDPTYRLYVLLSR